MNLVGPTCVEAADITGIDARKQLFWNLVNEIVKEKKEFKVKKIEDHTWGSGGGSVFADSEDMEGIGKTLSELLKDAGSIFVGESSRKSCSFKIMEQYFDWLGDESGTMIVKKKRMGRQFSVNEKSWENLVGFEKQRNHSTRSIGRDNLEIKKEN